MGRRILSEQRVVFVALLLIVGAAKWPVLSTPYHWDETLWIGFAHTLSGMPLWQVLPGLQPPSTFRGRPPGLFLTMAALFKETALAIVFSTAAYMFLAERGQGLRPALQHALRYAAPLLVMTVYYSWQKAVSGKFFVNYASGFDPFQLSVSSTLGQFPFCCLYFLPRYVLPCAPYFFLLAAWSLTEVVSSQRLRLGIGAALITLSLQALLSGRLVGNGEWSMAYLKAVAVQREACAYIGERFPNARVLTAWPYTVYLSQPALGYVTTALQVVDVRSRANSPRADVVVSGSPMGEGSDALAEYARVAGLASIKRIENDGARCEVYAAR